MVSNWIVLRLLVLTLLLHKSWQQSLPIHSYYVAGVVEFRPIPNFTEATSHLALEENLNGYIKIIQSEEAKPVDILVFPEATLSNKFQLTLVPDPKEDYVIPCVDDSEAKVYHQFLVDLSCQARNVSKYLVINISEKSKCLDSTQDPRPCASNGYNIFNTNVVFDRKGAVISRYRKTHPYGEAVNTTYVPEYAYFDTDFGVRFGHFICFDIMFYTPAHELVEQFGVTDVIFTTMWFSQLPFLTSMQYQQAWSYGNDVNLLAAGASTPLVGSTGSGIYLGRAGSAVGTMVTRPLGERTLLVARVPKFKPARSKHYLPAKSLSEPVRKSNYSAQEPSKIYVHLKRDAVEAYASVPLDLSRRNSFNTTLCYEKSALCCSFDLSWSRLNASADSVYYSYRLAVYSDWRDREPQMRNESNLVKSCALLACTSEDILDCGKIFPSNFTKKIEPQFAFEKIVIQGYFPKATEMLLMPNSLQDNLLPLDVRSFDWEVEKKECESRIQLSLRNSTSNLLTFGIYNNYYNSTNLCSDGQHWGSRHFLQYSWPTTAHTLRTADGLWDVLCIFNAGSPKICKTV